MWVRVTQDGDLLRRVDVYLKSVSGRLVTFVSSKTRVYVLRDRNPIGLSEIRSAGISIRTILIGRTDSYQTRHRV